MSDQTQERLQADIEAQRARLADTVDQLGHKLDVKAQAKERLDRVRPEVAVGFVAGLVLVVGLVWWRRRS